MAISELLSSTEFVSAIVGAVVGTLGAGGISFWLQTTAAQTAERVADKDRLERQTALARSLILKLSFIYTDVDGINEHVKPGYRLLLDDPKAPAWGLVLPVVNLAETTAITTEEVALILPLGDDEVTNAVINADRMRDAVYDAMREFSKMRRELNEKLPQRAPNAHGNAPITDEDLKRFPRENFELNHILQDVGSTASDYTAALERALFGAYRLLDAKYKLAFDISKVSAKHKKAL